jgi:hypothetical protein
MFERKRLGDNGTSAATARESGDRGDEMDEKDGQVAHLAIVPFSTSVTRLGTRWDLCDKSGIRHRQVVGVVIHNKLIKLLDQDTFVMEHLVPWLEEVVESA